MTLGSFSLTTASEVIWARAVPLGSTGPELVDGETHSLPGENAATFLRRTIRASSEERVELQLGSSDERQQVERPGGRPGAPCRGRAS